MFGEKPRGGFLDRNKDPALCEKRSKLSCDTQLRRSLVKPGDMTSEGLDAPSIRKWANQHPEGVT